MPYAQAAPSVDDMVVFEGPLHVIVYMGANIAALTGGRTPIGDPVRLAYVSGYEAAQDAADRVYATGRTEDVWTQIGWFHLIALHGERGIEGVACLLEQATRHARHLRRVLQPTG